MSVGFSKFFTETVNYKLEDFRSKWDKAISNSEELRVALEIMSQVMEKFPNGEIYIVGGVPRDLLMGNDIDDVDMATNIPISQLARYFELRNISKNDDQPVYALIYKGYSFDLAKFREDSQKEAGRQNNVSTEVDSFETDTKRRDISINSFGINYRGRIVDYQNGLEDLQNKIIRAVGNPKERFIEDATRILRVFRFAAKMNFSLDPETEKAAVELKHLLSDPKLISKESISKEFYKIAKSGPSLANFLEKLQNTRILHDILPEFTDMEGFTHNPKHHPEGGSTVLGHILECLRVSPYTDPVINLAVMFHDFGKAVTRGSKNGHSTYYGHEGAGVAIVGNIFDRLKFNELDAQDKKHILQAVSKHMLIHKLDELNIKTLTSLIHDPSWEILKAVGFCDEASRGSALFNPENFQRKIQSAEAKVGNLGNNPDELKARLKKYIDGNKLISQFPLFEKQKNKPYIKVVMDKIRDYLIELFNQNIEPTDGDVTKEIKKIIKELHLL